jgi:hypothetical protein
MKTASLFSDPPLVISDAKVARLRGPLGGTFRTSGLRTVSPGPNQRPSSRRRSSGTFRGWVCLTLSGFAVVQHFRRGVKFWVMYCCRGCWVGLPNRLKEIVQYSCCKVES